MQKAAAESRAEPSKDQSSAFSPKEGRACKKGTGADTKLCPGQGGDSSCTLGEAAALENQLNRPLWV